MSGQVVIKKKHTGNFGDYFYQEMTPSIQHEGGQMFYGTYVKSGRALMTKYWTVVFENVPSGNYVCFEGYERVPQKRTVTVRDGETTEVEF